MSGEGTGGGGESNGDVREEFDAGGGSGDTVSCLPRPCSVVVSLLACFFIIEVSLQPVLVFQGNLNNQYSKIREQNIDAYSCHSMYSHSYHRND